VHGAAKIAAVEHGKTLCGFVVAAVEAALKAHAETKPAPKKRT
jgi:hypothetical protein